jgi:putative hemolysin
MKRFYLILLLLVGICGYSQNPAFKNTAVEYCKNLGYKIIEDQVTKQRLCVLPNGERVNPWDFLHGDVGKEYSYCVKAGYSLRIKEVKKGRTVNHYPICDAKGKPSKSLMEMLYKDADFSSLFEGISRVTLPDTLPQLTTNAVRPPIETDQVLPTSFNWNNKDNHDWDNTPEDQGEYGICYAMAASSVAETVWNYKHNLPIDLGNNKNFSQAFIAFFGSYTYPQNPYEWWPIRGTWGLKKGYEGVPLQKLCTNGIIEESEFPWNPTSPDTVYTYSPCDRYRFTSFGKCPTTANGIKQDLLAYGPLTTTMIYDQEIHDFYYGQILSGNYNECGIEYEQNHMVVIVGWDFDETEGEYWIVKNSYGGDWGGLAVQGYMKIATDNSYGINCDAYYLNYSPIQILGGDLAYNQQAINNVPSGHRSIRYKPEPYTSFNGYSSENTWTDGSTANLDPKNINGLEAIIKFRVVYGQQNGSRLDPDSVELFEKPIWAGKPKTPTIEGTSNIFCYVPYWFEGAATSTNGLATAESFSWSHTGNIQILSTEDNPPRIRLQVPSPGEYSITLTATNNCGNTVSETFYLYCGDCWDFMAVLYPNPSSNELNINIEDNFQGSPDYQIDLLDSNSITRKQKKTKDRMNQFNVQDLRNGNYTVRVKALIDGQPIREKSYTVVIGR